MASSKTLRSVSLSIHHIQSARVSDIETFINPRTGDPFYFRNITFTLDDGETVAVGLYSDTNPSMPVTLAQDDDDGK